MSDENVVQMFIPRRDNDTSDISQRSTDQGSTDRDSVINRELARQSDLIHTILRNQNNDGGSGGNSDMLNRIKRLEDTMTKAIIGGFLLGLTYGGIIYGLLKSDVYGLSKQIESVDKKYEPLLTDVAVLKTDVKNLQEDVREIKQDVSKINDKLDILIQRK